MARGYIADLESNAVVQPRDPEKLKRVARALRVSFRWLIEPTEWKDDEQHDPRADLIIAGRSIEGLTEDDLRIVEQVAERLRAKEQASKS